jgi:hypothetical protein
MSARGLFLSLAVLVVGTIVVDLAIGRYARTHFSPNRLLAEARAAGDRCVLTLGDSRMAAGVDAAVLERTLRSQGVPVCVAPLALGAVGLEGQMMALRSYLATPRAPRLVILGVAMLLPGDVSDPSDMVGNRAVELAWSKASDVRLYYPNYPLEDLDRGTRFLIERSSALTSYQSLLWFRAQELQDRLIHRGAPRAANRFGLLSDMNALLGVFATNAESRLARADRWRNDPWFERIRAMVDRAGARLLVVHVPMTSAYRARVEASERWRSYAAWLEADLAAHGDEYSDLSSSADDSSFDDGIHLDARGAVVFSEVLGHVAAAVVPSSAGPGPG